MQAHLHCNFRRKRGGRREREREGRKEREGVNEGEREGGGRRKREGGMEDEVNREEAKELTDMYG